jgi:hypothetical protein
VLALFLRRDGAQQHRYVGERGRFLSTPAQAHTNATTTLFTNAAPTHTTTTTVITNARDLRSHPTSL